MECGIALKRGWEGEGVKPCGEKQRQNELPFIVMKVNFIRFKEINPYSSAKNMALLNKVTKSCNLATTLIQKVICTFS